MKKFFTQLIFIAGLFSLSNAQIAINTNDPQTTLDVTKSSKATVADGILIPRVTIANLITNSSKYGANQNSALIFITDGNGLVGTSQIGDPGFYYYDSANSKWIPVIKTDKYGNGSFTPNPVEINLTTTGWNDWEKNKNYNYFEFTGTLSSASIVFPPATTFPNQTIYLRNHSSGLITFTNIPTNSFLPSTVYLFGYRQLPNNAAHKLYSDGTRWYLMAGSGSNNN